MILSAVYSGESLWGDQDVPVFHNAPLEINAKRSLTNLRCSKHNDINSALQLKMKRRFGGRENMAQANSSILLCCKQDGLNVRITSFMM